MDVSKKMRGYSHSSQTAIVREDGSLVFDLYDFGSETMNEYITTLYVTGEAVITARADMERWARRPLASHEELADSLVRRFGSVSEARHWLEDQGIPFKEVYDPWATGDMPE